MISHCPNFFWLRQSIQGQSISWTPQFLISASAWFRKSLTPLKKFSQSSWGYLYIQARAGAAICNFHTSNEHNSTRKTHNIIGLQQLKNFNKRGQFPWTVNKESALEEEDRGGVVAVAMVRRMARSQRGRTEASTLDDTAVNVHWPLLLSRTWPASCSVGFLRRERDPHSARS
jgi:hypothetical protein